MPYVPHEARARLDPAIAAVPPPADAGELNYTLTRIVDRYLAERGLRYRHLNEVVGVLACVQLELYRRVAAPYEDAKAAEHGDVYHRPGEA